MVLLLGALFALSACVDLAGGGCGASPDPGCPCGYQVGYLHAGCGRDAVPACVPIQTKACSSLRCSCAGETVAGCDYATVPFAKYEACDAFMRPPDII